MYQKWKYLSDKHLLLLLKGNSQTNIHPHSRYLNKKVLNTNLIVAQETISSNFHCGHFKITINKIAPCEKM